MIARLASRAVALVGLGLTGCLPPATVAPPARPLRVVSLDYCADQYVLRLIDRARIAAVSPDATAEFSYMRDAAQGVQAVRPTAEAVLALRPDVVVRSYGGGPDIAAMLARAGVPTVQIDYADDVRAVRAAMLHAGRDLGAQRRAQAVVGAMDRSLAALPRGGTMRAALYVTPGGVTAGKGTLVDAMLRSAGLANFSRSTGWTDLPLERLARERPALVAAAFFDTRWNRPDPWSPAGHPVARAAFAGRPTVSLPGAWTACGGWFVADAIAALAKAGR